MISKIVGVVAWCCWRSLLDVPLVDAQGFRGFAPGRNKSDRPFGQGCDAFAYGSIFSEPEWVSMENCDQTCRFGNGVWVCRTLYDRFTGATAEVTACIDPDRSLPLDVCGCCDGQDCTAESLTCSCPCSDDDDDNDDNDMEKVLVQFIRQSDSMSNGNMGNGNGNWGDHGGGNGNWGNNGNGNGFGNHGDSGGGDTTGGTEDPVGGGVRKLQGAIRCLPVTTAEKMIVRGVAQCVSDCSLSTGTDEGNGDGDGDQGASANGGNATGTDDGDMDGNSTRF